MTLILVIAFIMYHSVILISYNDNWYFYALSSRSYLTIKSHYAIVTCQSQFILETSTMSVINRKLALTANVDFASDLMA